jgi:tetratricopeptide (TPR) repeat protein
MRSCLESTHGGHDGVDEEVNLTNELLEALTLVLAAAGLALFILAASDLIVASIRVGILGRPLVLPFRGTDERCAELTALFAMRLIEIEREWTAAAGELTDLKNKFHEQTRPAEPQPETENNSVEAQTAQSKGKPLAIGAPVLREPVTQPARDVVAGPRSTGDDFLKDILLLETDSSLAGADLGTVSAAGVSFSPQRVLAFLRRLPAVFARRVLSGSFLNVGERAILTVTYEERSFRETKHVTRRIAEFEDDAWLPVLDNIAFEIAKARIEQLRERRKRRHEKERVRARVSGSDSADRAPENETEGATASGSYSADRALAEAETWKASKAFLAAYASHLQHYVSGRASDRDQALRGYDEALKLQPGYTRAAYNRAVLSYNRYLPAANKQAIADFGRATGSDDPRVRALAFAGLAMAYCQAIHRFKADADLLAPEALDASDQALELDPDLEEARFARAWAHQAREAWDDALRQYETVLEITSENPPGRRIKSFALNNAGWIWLVKLQQRKDALLKAEELFRRALTYYPNKVAYANLAEVARRHQRYEDALAFFDRALELDNHYVNAWNERATLEIEIAAAAFSQGNERQTKHYIAEAAAHHTRATRIAEDEEYAQQLRQSFQKAIKKHARVLDNHIQALTRPA